MDPAFPDIVGEWAADEAAAARTGPANDNGQSGQPDELSDPFLETAIRLEVAATRLW
jgi:hypothetical protein